MKKLKVITIVGTRPEIIRLSRVIAKLDEYCNHVLVHTGQNYDYELNQIFFDDLGIRKPNLFLDAAGKSGVETIGNVIIAIDRLFTSETFDALLVLGDTNSCLAVIPAKRHKIPTFHMEAGNRCFDLRVPEEINRKIVDHTADVNLVYSSIAREYLLREGLSPDLVIKTGSPMREILTFYLEGIKQSKILDHLSLRVGKFFLISSHREENIDSKENFLRFVNILNGVGEVYGCPVIVSTHPRTRKQFDSFGVHLNPLVRLLKPMGFKDYNKLQISAKAVLSDSGTISEESSILNFPALNLREAHERPESVEEGAVMMVGLDVDRIHQGLAILEKQLRGVERSLFMVEDYSSNNVSEKVLRIIHSYTDYVNRVVWKKY
jgi:UDP-N-acetylglucosamine 2-epimerase (non-hydrolysing)